MLTYIFLIGARMINYDSIRYMNVYSKIYSMSYREMDGAFKDFYSICRENEIKLMGHVFYSINKLEDNDRMEIEIFFPAEKRVEIPAGKLRYRNYFIVEKMISVVVEGKMETNIKKAYLLMEKRASSKKQKLMTPFFHEIHRTGKKGYILVKAAVE